MKEKYTPQDLDLFYARFKKLPDYFELGRIRQLFNNPPPVTGRSAPHGIKPFNFFIMTTIITSILVSIIVFFPRLPKNDLVKNESSIPSQTVTSNTLENSINEIIPTETISKQITSLQAENNLPPVNETRNISTAQNYSDTIINGQKYILDLSFEELKNLGFDIRHHVVFYRNINPFAKCIFSSIISNGVIFAKLDPNSPYDKNTPQLRGTYDLKRDTFPENMTFFTRETRGWPTLGKNPQSLIYCYKSTSNNFYPLYTSDLSGWIISLLTEENFASQNDTLIPVVMRFSRLRCDLKQDLIFWFNPTNDFFTKIPERYYWIKSEYEALKDLKRINPKHDLVDYKVGDWVNKQLFPKDSLVDGSKFVVQLNDEELKKIGLFRTDKGGYKWSYQTPWGRGSSAGVKVEIIDGKPFHKTDTTFNTDFTLIYGTDTNGNFLSFNTTSKKIDMFLLENDILLPVFLKNSFKDWIVWLTISDSLWINMPERDNYLKDSYERIMFNKSFYPDKDLVIYFRDKMDKLDINVKILELTKSELENLGFQFLKDSLAMECVYNKEWLMYKSRDIWSKIKEKLLTGPLLPPEHYLSEYVHRIDSTFRGTERDRYFKYVGFHENCPNQGYQFVFITDTLGRHLHRFNPLSRKMLSEQNELNYLIPVLVRQSDYFREYAEDKIFWFTPTEEFFERLPIRIKGDIHNEFMFLTKKSGTTGCVYFEECRTTLDLSDFRVYPNPATSSVSVEFNNPQEMKGNISIVNILGSQVKVLLSGTSFPEGHNYYNLDLTGINPGIYLITIQTDKGLKTQRLIVSE